MKLSTIAKTQLIKAKAIQLGFDDCGIAKTTFLSEEREKLISWIDKKYNGQMEYMANNVEKRLDPRLLVDNSKSIIVLLLNYYPHHTQNDNTAPVIAKYAYGKDYHIVIKEKLQILYDYINTEIQEIEGRIFVDSAPVLEHAWAKKAGLGWIGKNSLLLNKKLGSFFFISELIIDLELDYDQEYQNNHCARCTKCIDACPTGAIETPHVVNGSKCISYFTIEQRDEIPNHLSGSFQNRVFGCDICQDVCPWNKKAKPHNTEDFIPNPDLLSLTKEQMINLEHEEYLRIFKKSAVKRTKYKGLKRNIDFLSKIKK